MERGGNIVCFICTNKIDSLLVVYNCNNCKNNLCYKCTNNFGATYLCDLCYTDELMLLVSQQTQCSLEQAKEALKDNDNDIVKAIMHVSTSSL